MTDTPLRDESRERKRQAWIIFAAAGMIVEIGLASLSQLLPWLGNMNGKGAKMADAMLKEYQDRWERE